MDAAHHDVPGSRRAETNDWGNMINATAYMLPPIIEKMDTASLDIGNGGRAQIHMNTHSKDKSDDDVSDDNPNDGVRCPFLEKLHRRCMKIPYRYCCQFGTAQLFQQPL